MNTLGGRRQEAPPGRRFGAISRPQPPDLGFVCPVSVSCVYLISVFGSNIAPVLFFSSKRRGCVGTLGGGFATRQTRFGCLRDRNTLRIVTSILACVPMVMIQTLYRCSDSLHLQPCLKTPHDPKPLRVFRSNPEKENTPVLPGPLRRLRRTNV